MADSQIRNRTVTVRGTLVKYTYDVRNREVTVPGHESFTALCWDTAPEEVAERVEKAPQVVWSNKHWIDSPDQLDTVTGYSPLQAHCHCGWNGAQMWHMSTHLAIADLNRHSDAEHAVAEERV